jgi:hypothetical protein
MMEVLDKTQDKLDIIINGEASGNATANTTNASGRKKRAPVILYECHNVNDALTLVTNLLVNGTVLNGTYEVSKIERICQSIIDCDVTKAECEEEGILADLTAAHGKCNFRSCY